MIFIDLLNVLTLGSSGMLGCEFGQIPDFTVHNDPAVFGRVVLGDFLDREQRFFFAHVACWSLSKDVR